MADLRAMSAMAVETLIYSWQQRIALELKRWSARRQLLSSHTEVFELTRSVFVDKVRCEGVMADETGGSIAELATEEEVDGDETVAGTAANRSKSRFNLFGRLGCCRQPSFRTRKSIKLYIKFCDPVSFKTKVKETNLQLLNAFELATSPKHFIQTSTFWEKAPARSSQYRYWYIWSFFGNLSINAALMPASGPLQASEQWVSASEGDSSRNPKMHTKIAHLRESILTSKKNKQI